ncbi:MAG: hypothetical protein RLN90_00720 [Balneolaceae bacterium]
MSPNIDLNDVEFSVNDSTIAPHLTLLDNYAFSISVTDIPTGYNSIIEAKITFNEKEEVVRFTRESCSPSSYAYFNAYIVTDNQYKLTWRSCDNLPSSIAPDDFVIDTDYSIVELKSGYTVQNENDPQAFTMDTSIISFNNHLYMPLEFVPPMDLTKINLLTKVRVTNVQGSLPDQKQYLNNREFPIRFSKKSTSALGGIFYYEQTSTNSNN